MRVCFNCQSVMPPETEHFEINNDLYCTECVDAQPYTSYSYYIDGEYMGNSEGDGDVRYIESFEDDYEPEET